MPWAQLAPRSAGTFDKIMLVLRPAGAVLSVMAIPSSSPVFMQCVLGAKILVRGDFWYSTGKYSHSIWV